MIKLFDVPKCTINLSHFDNILHDKVVRQFEQKFANYVGARHACSFNSASSAIFLALRMIADSCPAMLEKKIQVPSTIPPVVPNTIINAGYELEFNNNVQWIGNHYTLANFGSFRIIDSAQAVYRETFKQHMPQDLMVFSFYPTKPVGGIDGGMIVSDDSSKIEYLRKMSMNGTDQAINSWERSLTSIGWKMYMNSAQAQVACYQLELLDERQHLLDRIRSKYRTAFEDSRFDRYGTIIATEKQNGYHLYRIAVANNDHFISKAKADGICCGIHYRALHNHPTYSKYAGSGVSGQFTISNMVHMHSASIPFHAGLEDEDIVKVINFVKTYRDKYGPPED